MLKQAEQAIVDRLTTAPKWPKSARVEAWPDSPIELGRAQMKDGVYVRFAGLNLEAVQGQRQPYVQMGRAEFEIRLLIKDLRSHVGAYELIELIHHQLTAFRPSNSDGYAFQLPGLYLTKAVMVDRYKDSAQWDWGAMFSIGVTYEGRLNP
jgi:hypothetical protein